MGRRTKPVCTALVKPLLLSFAVVPLIALAACGSAASSSPAGAAATGSPGTETLPPGDIPDTVAYTTFAPPSAAYLIRIPEGFARADTGSAIVFTFHFNSITLQTIQAAGQPSIASAQTADVTAIKTMARSAAIGDISTVTRSAGTAILIKYQADSAPDPVTGKIGRLDVERYEFWHNGTELVITLAAPAGSDNVDPWTTITNSLQWR